MTRLRARALPAAIALCAVALAAAPPAVLIGYALAHLDAAGRWLTPFLTRAFADQLLLTAWVAALSAAVAVSGALPLALATSRYRLPLPWAIEACALSPLLLAPYTAAGAWAKIFDLKFGQGPAPMAVEIGLASLPWVYLLLRVSQARIPETFDEVVRVNGASAWQAFVRVRLRMLFAPCAVGALFAAARAFGDFGCAERNGVNSFGVGFVRLWASSQDDAAAAAYAAVSCLPGIALAIACLIFWRRFVPQVPPAGGGAWGVPTPRAATPTLTTFAWVWAAAIMLCGFLLPELQFVSWAIDVPTPPLGRIVAIGVQTLASAAAVCALLALLASLLVVIVEPGTPGAGAVGSLWLLSANLFYPPLAFTLVWVIATADTSPLAGLLGEMRNSAAIVVLAQGMKFAPLVLLPAMDCLLRESPSTRAMLRVGGLSRARRLGHTLAFFAPAIALGSALVFVEAVKELEVASTLQPFGYQAISLKIHALARFQAERQIAPWALAAQLLMLPALAIAWAGMSSRSRRDP